MPRYKDFRTKFSNRNKKWVHGMFTLVVGKNRQTGDLRVFRNCWGSEEYPTMTDGHMGDLFIWIGNYLALKGKLPRHMALDQIAVGAQRTSKAIREVIATEHFQILRNSDEQK